LGVSVETLRKRLERGTIAGVKVNQRWVVYVPRDATIPDRVRDAPRQRHDSIPDEPRPPCDTFPDIPEAVPDALATLRSELAYSRELLTRSDAERDRLTRQVDQLALALEREQVAHGETRRLLLASMAALPVPTRTERADAVPLDAEPPQTSHRPWWAFWRTA
jgi:hypothetical protein